MSSVAALSLAPGEARVAFRTDAEGRVPLLELLRSRARGVAGTDARALAAAQLRGIQAAVRAGELPRRGSFLPYVRFVVEAAERQDGPARERARGALYALALYCGDPGFETAVGVSLPGRMQGRRNGCAGTTLGDRDDLRRHFAISAGLDAATSGTAAFGMGELKELLDSNPGGSGFSFDDMAADAAGVRFARTFLGAPPEDWPGLAARIADEDAVLPSLAGLPSRLSADEFEARYGSVDSDAYASSSPRSTGGWRRCRCTARSSELAQRSLAASHCSRKAISASCAAMISSARARISGSWPCSSTTRAMAMAPWWCGIMPRAKSMSASPL